MNTYGSVTAPGTLVFQRLLSGSVERVWQYLTDSERRAEWLAGGPMELEVGGRVELHFRHDELSPVEEAVPEKYRDLEQGQSVSGRVTRCEPPRLLAYTWGEASGESSEVTFELEARGEQVLLTLTHRRLDDAETLLSVAAGWHTHLGILDARLAGRAAQPFWSVHEALEQEYAARLGDAAAEAGRT